MGTRKWFTAILAICMVSALTLAAYAYLSNSFGPVDNQFGAASDPAPSIAETFEGNMKTDVAVDVGDPGYAVYVRAVIVVTWEDGSGNILAQKPVAGTDYSMELMVGAGKDWFEKDGFFYYRSGISSGSTSPLIAECRQLKDAPDGYALHVQIISQTVQALGTTDSGNVPAVTDAWGVSVNSDGSLSDA